MKYKLIKEYPGSPKLGTIFEKIENKDNDLWLEVKCSGAKYYQNNMSNLFQNYPEFWEKVVEKEYEILSFYFKNIAGKGDAYVDKDYIWKETSEGSGMWSRDGYITASYSTEEMLQNSNYGIHSVKRTSDGKVFTIGDVVENQNPVYDCRGPITKFKIASGLYDDIEVHYCGYNYMHSIKHSKQPLFITEDGVEIFPGIQKVYYVDNKSLEIDWCHPDSGFYLANKDCIKTFSTIEKAEEYVLYNKPCLSIKDVASVINTPWLIDVLKGIVKEKIKTE